MNRFIVMIVIGICNVLATQFATNGLFLIVIVGNIRYGGIDPFRRCAIVCALIRSEERIEGIDQVSQPWKW